MRSVFFCTAIIFSYSFAAAEIEIVEVEIPPGKYQHEVFFHAAVDDGNEIKSAPAGPGRMDDDCIRPGQKVSICKQENDIVVDEAEQFSDSGWCRSSASNEDVTLEADAFYRLDREKEEFTLLTTSRAISEEAIAVSVVEMTLTRIGDCDQD